MDYVTFEVRIDKRRENGYPVSAGDRDGILVLPFEPIELETRMLRLENAILRSGAKARDVTTDNPDVAREFGEELFGALFNDEILAALRTRERDARKEGKRLRISLRVEAPEVASLPWEFLYDAKKGGFVALNNTPIVRYLKSVDETEPSLIKPPLKILGMVSSPNDRTKLDVGNERKRLEQALRKLIDQGLVELSWVEDGTWRTLQKRIREGWHVFHFIGHGGFDGRTGHGVLAFTSEQDGTTYKMSSEKVGNLLSNATDLRLVVLNACEGARASETDVFSSTAGHLIRIGIPAAIAMQYPISDRAALEFSRVFYESAIASGQPVDSAMVDARNAISLSEEDESNTVEWGTPVLFMKSNNGRLFEMSKVPVVVPKKEVAKEEPPQKKRKGPKFGPLSDLVPKEAKQDPKSKPALDKPKPTTPTPKPKPTSAQTKPATPQQRTNPPAQRRPEQQQQRPTPQQQQRPTQQQQQRPTQHQQQRPTQHQQQRPTPHQQRPTQQQQQRPTPHQQRSAPAAPRPPDPLPNPDPKPRYGRYALGVVALAIVAYAAMNWPAPPPEPPDLSPVVFLDTPSDRAYESSGLGDAFGTAGSVLMDGNIGTRDPKKDPPGTWVAFIGQSAQLTIDRLESGPFSHVRVGFLERDSYWVVGPTEVRVSVADQNNVEAWYLAGIWSPMDRREEPFRFWQAHKRGEIVVNIDARAQGRYVRLEIASPETRTRPEYETRLGSVWIALDEVVID